MAIENNPELSRIGHKVAGVPAVLADPLCKCNNQQVRDSFIMRIELYFSAEVLNPVTKINYSHF